MYICSFFDATIQLTSGKLTCPELYLTESFGFSSSEQSDTLSSNCHFHKTTFKQTKGKLVCNEIKIENEITSLQLSSENDVNAS